MPYVKVEITGGATTEQKLAIHKGMTDVLVKVLGKNPDYVFVVIDEVAAENWGHKGTSVAELNKAAAATKKPTASKPAAKKPAPRKAAAKRGAVAEDASLKRGPTRKS